jgi:hypothetical protein
MALASYIRVYATVPAAAMGGRLADSRDWGIEVCTGCVAGNLLDGFTPCSLALLYICS